MGKCKWVWPEAQTRTGNLLKLFPSRPAIPAASALNADLGYPTLQDFPGGKKEMKALCAHPAEDRRPVGPPGSKSLSILNMMASPVPPRGSPQHSSASPAPAVLKGTGEH